MFNQLTPADIVRAIGVTVRGAARGGAATSDFERDQLMSAYSATRHLAVELSSYEPVLREFATATAGRVRVADLGLEDVADRFDRAPASGALGDAVSELLDRLRGDESAPAQR